MSRPRIAAWQGVIGACAVLALPTAVAPGSLLAGVTYMAALTIIVLALVVGSHALPPAHRGPWALITVASACAAAGAVVWQVSALLGRPDGAGPKDALWITFYPLMIIGVLRMVKARALPRATRRAMGQDVAVVTAAAAVLAWHTLVKPILAGSGGEDRLTAAVTICYPLGDVSVFALGLALVLAPGRRSTAEVLLVGSLGLALPVDYLHAWLPLVAPDAGDGWYMAAYLVINGLLGATALHPDRAVLTSPAVESSLSGMQKWRMLLLGTALCGVCLSTVFVSSNGWDRVPAGVAVTVMLTAILTRLHRAIWNQERAEQSLRYQAHHDHLTGLANRTLLLHDLRNAVRRDTPTLIFVDLDRFKAVNDTFGHHCGDELLIVVARRLTGVVRPTDTVARIGGDEFVLLCHGVADADIEPLAVRIGKAVRQPLVVEGNEVQIGASVGVLTLDAGYHLATEQTDMAGTETLVSDLLRRADAAMYEAKRAGGGTRIIRYSVAA